MTAVLVSPIDSMICARCDGTMVITKDACGRDRKRCPRCDGVAPPRAVHPDDVRMPQALVRAFARPTLAPGQLHCQGCTAPVPESDRFCPTCLRVRPRSRKAPRTCPCGCGAPMPTTPGRPPKRSPTCRTRGTE